MYTCERAIVCANRARQSTTTTATKTTKTTEAEEESVGISLFRSGETLLSVERARSTRESLRGEDTYGKRVAMPKKAPTRVETRREERRGVATNDAGSNILQEFSSDSVPREFALPRLLYLRDRRLLKNLFAKCKTYFRKIKILRSTSKFLGDKFYTPRLN